MTNIALEMVEAVTWRGVGRFASAEAFRLACSQFIAIEDLESPVVQTEVVRCPSDVLGAAFNRLGPGKWHKLGKLGNELKKLGSTMAEREAMSGGLLKQVEKCGAFRIRRAADGHPEIARRT